MTLEEFHNLHPIHHNLPDVCWCGGENKQSEDHLCGECPEHCELQAHREGRPSPRDSALRRQYEKRRTLPFPERRSA